MTELPALLVQFVEGQNLATEETVTVNGIRFQFVDKRVRVIIGDRSFEWERDDPTQMATLLDTA